MHGEGVNKTRTKIILDSYNFLFSFEFFVGHQKFPAQFVHLCQPARILNGDNNTETDDGQLES
jgi:hypothetical protein